MRMFSTKGQKRCRSVRFFVYFSFALLAPNAFALSIVITPERDLSSVKAAYSWATNQTDRGMFREAEATIEGGIEKAMRRLHELDKRRAIEAPFRAFVARIQDICGRFDDNWTNAVYEAYALEAPLKDFVATNDVIKSRLDWHLKSFQWLRKDFEDGNKQDVEANLRHLRYALEREAEAFESSKSCEEGFRAALGNLEKAREHLVVERGKPLDAKRALRIAWDYYAETTNMIASPHGSFVCYDAPRDAARAYLQDIRRTGALEKEVDELWKALDDTKRAADLAGVRYYMGMAKEAMEKRNPYDAKMYAESAESLYLSQLRSDPVYSWYLAELKGVKCAAEQLAVEQKQARVQTEIQKQREKPGFANAPILDKEILCPEGMAESELIRFSAETDLAAVLRREFSCDNMDIAIDRGRGGAMVIFPDDPNHIPTIRKLFQQSFNTNYPTSFPGGEHFCLMISPDYHATGVRGMFYTREWQAKDGRTVREIVPVSRIVNVIRTSARPNDAYLYFTGSAKCLFKPGGRTVLIPGLGAYLAKKRPPANEKDRSGWVYVNW